MTRHRVTERMRRPLALWCAVLVAVLFVMAPTLGHALAFASGSERFEICTAQGLKPAAPDSAPAPAHCPFCLHQADRIAPPPSLLPYLLRVAGAQQEMPVWQVLFFKPIYRRWLEPRGPPTA